MGSFDLIDLLVHVSRFTCPRCTPCVGRECADDLELMPGLPGEWTKAARMYCVDLDDVREDTSGIAQVRQERI